MKKTLDLTKKEITLQKNEPEPDIDYELEIDACEAIVSPVDGVIIEGDDEEIKLLFYHFKPKGIDVEGEIIRCKCVVEFRISRHKFLPVAKHISEKARALKFFQRNLSEYAEKYDVTMFS